jgi:DNA-directed RNA polymerase specialized sigma24 family protein
MDVIRGSRPSFEERFTALAALSYKVGYRLVGDRAVAEELAQEALARAYASWRKVAGHDEAWVSRVTTNLVIDRWRKDRRLVPAPAGDHVGDRGAPARGGPGWPPSPPPPDPLVRLELVAALRALPRRQRQVVTMRYLADLPEAEVAAALGCSPGTVKQHAHRGLAALRLRLTDPRPSDSDRDAEEDNDVRAS